MIKKFQESYTKPKTKGGENMNKISKIFFLFFVATFLIAGSANAALIGIDRDTYPDIYSDTSGHYSYISATDEFKVNAYAQTIVYFDGGIANFIYNGSYLAQFKVDHSGDFMSGIPDATDLVIRGSLTQNGPVVDLLTGEMFNFGWNWDSDNKIIQFDYVFNITGGSLADLFGGVGNNGGSFSYAEVPSFNGWEKDNSGSKVKTDTFPTPEPGTLLLLGTGLAGLAFYRRRRK